MNKTHNLHTDIDNLFFFGLNMTIIIGLTYKWDT